MFIFAWGAFWECDGAQGALVLSSPPIIKPNGIHIELGLPLLPYILNLNLAPI